MSLTRNQLLTVNSLWGFLKLILPTRGPSSCPYKQRVQIQSPFQNSEHLVSFSDQGSRIPGHQYLPVLFFKISKDSFGPWWPRPGGCWFYSRAKGDIQKDLCFHMHPRTAVASAPVSTAGHCQSIAPQEILKHRQVWLSLLGVTSPFPWVLVPTKFCLFPPRVFVFPSSVDILYSNINAHQSQIPWEFQVSYLKS